ncbi:unnamed protein product, partial [Aphanomyces euteiches]
MARQPKAKTLSKKELQEQVRQLQQVLRAPPGCENAVSDGVVEEVEAVSSVTYSDEIVIILLELRYERFKEAFMNCNSNQTKCSLWERLALQFNIISNSEVAVTTPSLKNKEYDLRAKYKAIRIKEG